MSLKNLRQLPSVDKILSDNRIGELCQIFPRDTVIGFVRNEIEEIRGIVVRGGSVPSVDEIISFVITKSSNLESGNLRRVINATGVILHTNMGRAPLSSETIEAMTEASLGYSNLEFDLDTGKRGSRQVHLEQLLCQLTGAEAALVVNNNASGVLLGLTTIAKRKEVIVSRGQAVEIGGGFRIPEVAQQSGAKLIEVGTTNRTYPADYEQAITPRTAALLLVHPSNFRIVGFTCDVSLGDMVALGGKYNLPVLNDIGSGCLIDTTSFGLKTEPQLRDIVFAGASLIFFSGDKLIGGPQAGIIVGKKKYIDRMRKHQLYRALRVDKIRLAGLAATLVHYLKGEATEKIPILRLMATPLSDIERRAKTWSQSFGNSAKVIPGESMIGGGSLPGNTLPTWLVCVRIRGVKVQNLVRSFRMYRPPVIGRIEKNNLLLDPRSVFPEEDDYVISAIKSVIGEMIA